MYFSKNSRYVLRRAQFISSTSYFLNCIKGVKNKYSVKSPKDDPTKPPLRLNIPSESSRGLETYTGVSQGSSRTYQEDFSEPRSKSLLSKPNSLTTNFEDDYYNIQRSGSELQFSNFKEETKRSECDPETFASANQNKCSNLGVDISKSESLVIDSVAHQKNETDVNEGLVTFIEENYSSNTTREHESPENLKNDCKSATQFQEKMETQIPFQGKLDNESKSLYIVINMPESSGELADANVTKVPEQKTAVSCDWKADQSLTKSVSDKNLSTKTDWEGNGNNLISNLKTRGKSFSNLPSKAGEGKSNPKIKFKVYEIDDATAYVFHLRLHNKLRRKACAVGRVLEKEIKARSEDFIDGNSHIQSRIPVVNSKKNYKTWGENVALAENNMDHLKIREMKIQNRFKREKKSAESCKKKNKSTTNFGKLGETWKSKSFQKSNSSASCQSRKRSKHKNHDSMYYMYPGISSKTFSCKSSTANSCCAEVASNKAKPSTKAEVAANSNLEVFDENYYKNIEGPDNANSKLCKMKNPTIEGGSHYDDTKQQNFAKKREPINSNGTQMLALADYAQQLNVKSNCQKTSCNWSHDDSDAKKYENIYNVEEADTPKRFQVPEDFSKTQDKQMKYAYGSKRSCDRKKKFEKTGNTSSKPSKGVKFSSDNERTENNETNQGERINFQTCASVFQISSDVPSYPTRFSAAYPPILNEVMTIRSKGLGLKKKDSFLNSKLCRINFLTSEYETKALNAKSVNDLSENSILFPKNEEEKFDCSSLFTCKRNDGLKVFDTDSKSPKISDNMINMANETLTESKGEPSLDSLTMMKKVKEIVDFDLNNAVKIFKDGETEPRKEVSSVVIDRGHWEVDEAELEKCIAIQKDRTLNEVTQPMLSCAQESIVKYADQTNHEIINANDKRNKIEKGLSTPTFFPGRKENETMMRVTSDAVNSVITYNPTDNRFDIYSPDIDEAMRQSNKSFDILHSKAATPIVENNQNLLKVPIDDSKSTSELETYEMKSGDSILVFDELTQTWNVDYSILEKRKERMRQEEELTKKSELILENFEKLEQRNISNFPKPDSREKKIFDYNSKKWKEYKSNEKSNSSGKSTKSKCPFKESDAEEIRKENSDLYENLFVVKKETKMSTEGPESSGVNPGVTKKEASSNNTIMTKDSSDGSKGSDKPPLKDNENLTNKTNVPTQKKEVDVPKEEDSNFWETFLKKNIPPFERPPEPRPVTPPPPSPPPTPQPPLPSTPPPPPYAEKIISKIKMPVSPLKKIDEPRFRIPLPFNWDRKKEVPKLKTPKTDKKQNNSEGKGPLSSPNPLPPTKEERPAIKPPSPPPGPPGPAKPNPTTPIGSPKQERPAIKVPPPPTTPQVKDSPSVKNPSPPTGNSKKEDIVIKAPQSAPTLPKQDPQSKTPPAVGSSTKNTSLLCTEKDIPQIKASKNSDEAEIAQELKPKVTGSSADVKKEKNPSEHYVSDNIVEMSKSHTKDFNSKAKSNKIETVKLNITSEARMPSRITEINLKFDETIKESNAAPKKTESNEKKKFSNNAVIKDEKSSTENRFYKNFEKYKSPFSDPEYEEKSMKINSDLESNPNLKKLDNWNKTLVLHDTVKPPENIESWLKDETDKMATLLLKVLQEAAEGKPRKKPALIKGRSSDRTSSKGNPYDNIRKKQESSPESFLFKVRSVNLALEADKKLKTVEATKQEKSNLKNIPVQSAKTVKPSKIVDAITSGGEANQTPPLKGKTSANQTRILFADPKPRLTELTLEPIESNLNSKDLSNSKLVGDTVNDIPGPEILKKISNTWKLLPVIDSQITIFTLRRIFQLVNLTTSLFDSGNPDKSRRYAFSKLFSKYGPIVNLQGLFSGNVILIHKPEHFLAVFEQDATSTVRSVFDSLDQSRRKTDDKLLSIGVSTDWSKPEWNSLKKASSDPLHNGYKKYFGLVELAGDSLVNSIRRNKNNQNIMPEDFMDEIKKWSLEGLCNVLFARSFAFLDTRSSNVNWLPEPDKLSGALEDATEYLSKCERGFQIWRFMATPSLIGLGQAYRSLATILSRQIYQSELNLKNRNERLKDVTTNAAAELTYVESMLLFDGMTQEEIACNLVDTLIVGTNTMSSALGFVLYHLAQNSKVQSNLLKEIKRVLPEKTSRLDHQKLSSLKYLHACIKESLRLNTPFPLFFRLLQNDIVLSHYIIPKGTFVVMDSRVSSMKVQIFDEPEKFVPERWLNDEKWLQNFHPFSSFPVCHGSKSDLAKQILEIQLCSCIAKVVRNFEIEYRFGEIKGTESVISLPDKPLKLNFIERND